MTVASERTACVCYGGGGGGGGVYGVWICMGKLRLIDLDGSHIFVGGEIETEPEQSEILTQSSISRYERGNLLVIEHSFSEVRETAGPDVVACHGPVVRTRCAAGGGLFPPDVEAFVQIASVLWVRVLAQERGVALEVRALVDVHGQLAGEGQGEEPFRGVHGITNRLLGDPVVLD